jgi:hypothetical protein
MKFVFFMLALGLSTSSAFAGIQPVSAMATTFECDGLLPNVTGSSGTSVAAGDESDVHLPKGTITYSGYEAFFQGIHIGTVNDAPTCFAEKTADPAHPSRNKLELDAGVAFTLNAQADGHHTLSLALRNDKSISTTW